MRELRRLSLNWIRRADWRNQCVQWVKSILNAPIPVIVYVAPSGAQAASAGVMITLASDVAAMAPGTNIGAAHPVGAGGGDIDGEMEKKILNDMTAFVQGIAKERGRNQDWAKKAVGEKHFRDRRRSFETRRHRYGRR